MAVNKYFNNFNYGREQDLVEDLIIESIKQYGNEVKYLPRSLVQTDTLFDEDTLSKFETAIPIEMYIKNVEGFEGEGEFLDRFGIQINNQITFTVARKRWDQISAGESILDEIGYSYMQESANTAAPGSTVQYQLEAGTPGANNYAALSTRPNEGDLIWFEMANKLFEIKHTEHEQVFYQNGKLTTYDLRCELFSYSSEALDTGDTSIDTIEDTLSQNTLDYQFSLDDDGTYGAGNLMGEDGGSLLQEFRVETTQATANNEFFGLQSASIIDFSETNPFSEVDRF